ncbi:MAG TPA: fibronectin type III domain-containing protein [Bryobacteraceae bacterium]|nr:fibronectin type III domain-containing protein [Bryobacteraceae bacterium]
MRWALVFLTMTSGAQVLTQHNDASRSGANLHEAILNTANVNVNQFGKLFERPVDAEIYAQPLYVPHLRIGDSIRNVVYVATEGNTVYAFDADDPSVPYPLWTVNLGTPVYDTSVNCTTDLIPQIGITSTPVIDLATRTIYVDAKSTDSSGFHHRLHALDLLTGNEKFNGPVEVAATVPGTGAGSVNGHMTFDPRIQNNRPGLALANGMVYLGFGSHCDANNFHGWLFGFGVNSAGTLERTSVLLTTPNGAEGGVWQAGQGPVIGHNGHLYLMSGNGNFDVSTGGVNVGDSVLNLSPSLTVSDYFTPYNQDRMRLGDLDLGSSGLLEISDLPGLPRGVRRVLVGGGKLGTLYLMNEDHLGGYGMTDNVLQEWQASVNIINGSPVFWKGPNGMWLYLWGGHDTLKQFTWSDGSFQTTPSYVGPEVAPYPGGILSLSANGSIPGTGILWATSSTASANHATVPGILHAYDASNVSNELWNSYQNQSRDDFGNLAKFCPPTVANGKVYMATFSNKLVVYGLSTLEAPTRLKADAVGTTVVLTWKPSTGATSNTGYYVYRTVGPPSVLHGQAGDATTTQLGPTSLPTFTDTGLQPGTMYTYYVEAYDSNGFHSAPSNAQPVKLKKNGK